MTDWSGEKRIFGCADLLMLRHGYGRLLGLALGLEFGLGLRLGTELGEG